MKFPTHFIRPEAGLVLKNGAPWLVYGWLAADGSFIALDGRKYPGDGASPIEASGRSFVEDSGAP